MNLKMKNVVVMLMIIGPVVFASGCLQETPASSTEELMMESTEMAEEMQINQEKMEAQITEMETLIKELKTEMSLMTEPVEDTSISTMEEVTAWIDHFIIRRERINVGDKVNIHVHVRRRDTLDEVWNGKIRVSFDEAKIERSIPLSNTGDDHYDYSFDTEKPGNFTVKVEIYDEVGILDSSEGQLLVADS